MNTWSNNLIALCAIIWFFALLFVVLCLVEKYLLRWDEERYRKRREKLRSMRDWK